MHLVSQIVADGENGQDRVCVLRFDDRVVLAIADGAGGRSRGAEAASLAIEMISQFASGLHSEDACTTALFRTHSMIQKNDKAGETSAVVAVAKRFQVFGASIGDSGAWVVSEESIDELSSEQNRRPFLGNGTAIPVGFSRPHLSGTLLLATDGLLKYANRDLISWTVRKSSFEFLCKELVRLVRYPSGALPDDVAIAICRLAEPTFNPP
jgi:serine/threonine protein phosphatase PrpC